MAIYDEQNIFGINTNQASPAQRQAIMKTFPGHTPTPTSGIDTGFTKSNQYAEKEISELESMAAIVNDPNSGKDYDTNDYNIGSSKAATGANGLVSPDTSFREKTLGALVDGGSAGSNDSVADSGDSYDGYPAGRA